MNLCSTCTVPYIELQDCTYGTCKKNATAKRMRMRMKRMSVKATRTTKRIKRMCTLPMRKRMSAQV